METTEKQIRKKSPKKGLTQTRVTFRCDNDVYELLQKRSNIGRTINEALSFYLGDITS